jgi:hypothetical protein
MPAIALARALCTSQIRLAVTHHVKFPPQMSFETPPSHATGGDGSNGRGTGRATVGVEPLSCTLMIDKSENKAKINAWRWRKRYRFGITIRRHLPFQKSFLPG